MGRIYKVSTEAVSVSAAQDLIQAKGATGKVCRVRGVKVQCTDTTIPTAQMLDIRLRFLPATVTDGSGGTTPTPQKTDQGDAAASFTALANNTSKATTSGTAQVLAVWGEHLYSGLDVQFASDQLPTFGPSTSVVLELLSTPTGTAPHISSEMTVEEIG